MASTVTSTSGTGKFSIVKDLGLCCSVGYTSGRLATVSMLRRILAVLGGGELLPLSLGLHQEELLVDPGPEHSGAVSGTVHVSSPRRSSDPPCISSICEVGTPRLWSRRICDGRTGRMCLVLLISARRSVRFLKDANALTRGGQWRRTCGGDHRHSAGSVRVELGSVGGAEYWARRVTARHVQLQLVQDTEGHDVPPTIDAELAAGIGRLQRARAEGLKLPAVACVGPVREAAVP